MTVSEMYLLSDEELKAISMRKNQIGNNTIMAERAMAIRRERCCHWDEIDKYDYYRRMKEALDEFDDYN